MIDEQKKKKEVSNKGENMCMNTHGMIFLRLMEISSKNRDKSLGIGKRSES